MLESWRHTWRQSPSRHTRLDWRLSLAISLISIFLLWEKSVMTVQDNHWASDRHLWMLLTSFSSALSEQNILTRQFCLTLHLKVFRVSDYRSLRHFLYIGTRLIRTPRGMPYWDPIGTRHTGTPRGHAILEHQRDTPYWDTMGTRHTGTPRGHSILGHPGDTPYWNTKGTRPTRTPWGQAK